jgi:hypothetical protein
MPPLPVIADVFLAALGLMLGLAHGRVLFRRGVRLSSTDLPKRARLLVGVGVGFGALNMIYLPVKHYPAAAWFIPVVLDYYGVVVAWVVDLLVMAFLFGAAVAVAVLERHPLRRALPLVAVVFLGAAMQTYHTFVVSTPPELRDARFSTDGTILQTSGASCAAAACANIATALGVPKSEKEMAALLGTTVDGTSNAEVVRGMEGLGFRCVKRYIRDRDASRLQAPAMLVVDLVGQVDGHAVAYMGQKGGKAEIWDPTGGKRWLNAEELRGLWRGRAIEVRR